MLLANLTPESAAAFMRQSKQSANFFNVPLTVGQPVRVDTAPMEIMGASLRTNTNMTLTSWEEGKVAHLHYVMAPTDEDLHNFMATLLGSMFGSLLQGKEGAAEAKTILDRMIQNMEMTMSVACDVDFSLVNYVDTHQVCDTKTFVKMDMKKIMPPEMLKDNPAQAEQLPVITMTQTDHLTSDSNLVQ
ncbi:MAG: hypothetical protein JF615_13845 [Asticcacaulis sp.]|nr:hypothetical protein [Asticcacaulis sp.]